MKRSLLLVVLASLLLAACTPSESAIQTAIAQTQTAEAELNRKIQAAIAQTQKAAYTLVPTYTPTFEYKSIPSIRSTKTAVPPDPKSNTQPTAFPIPPTVSHPVLDITIKVVNQCAEQHTVIFNGPVRLKYIVAPGETKEWQGAKGTYTWTVDGIVDGTQELFVSVWTLTLCY